MCVLCRFGEPEIQRTQEDVQEAVLKSIILEMLYTIIFRYYSNISMNRPEYFGDSLS